MRRRRGTTRQPIIRIIHAVLLVATGILARGEEALPGSTLDLRRAKQEARYIVAAEVGKTGDVLGSCMMWTELKHPVMLKGQIGEDELNRLPLSVRIVGDERFPRRGEEFVFFIGDRLDSGVIAKVMSKSDRAAIEAAPPAPAPPPAPAVLTGGGIGGIDGLGGDPGGAGWPAEPPPPRPYSDRGTRIFHGPGAVGDRLNVQQEFAAALARDDPKPEDRKAHFAWLDRNEYARRYGVRQVGWYGIIADCEPRPGGGWRVEVAVRPWLEGTGIRHCFVLDTVEETYEFQGGRVRLVGSNAAVPKPKRQGFPVAW